MGVFSKTHRYREAGEEANVNNVARFGVPVRSLFSTSKVMSLRHKIEITDSQENVVYRAETQFPSIRDKTDLYDAAGSKIAHIERKVFTLHEKHNVTMGDGTEFVLSNELFHLIKDITNIEGLGWQLRGNRLGLNFEFYDENEAVVAVIAQKMISLHDKYCIDIYQPSCEKTAVAIFIALQHMMKDREAASSASSSAASSS